MLWFGDKRSREAAREAVLQRELENLRWMVMRPWILPYGGEALAHHRAGRLAAGVSLIEAMETASMEGPACLERMAHAGESSPKILCVGH